MIETAHFTLSELPGTLAIWVAGIGAGIALASRGTRAAAAPLGVMAALAVLGMLGDTNDWAQSLKIAIDSAFLVTALAVVVLLWRGMARSAERSSSA